jgi:hypothetical protein
MDLGKNIVTAERGVASCQDPVAIGAIQEVRCCPASSCVSAMNVEVVLISEGPFSTPYILHEVQFHKSLNILTYMLKMSEPLEFI